MEATMNFIEFQEIEIGETFIIIHTGDRSEREKLDSKKEVYVKTAEPWIDNMGPDNAVQLVDGEPALVAHRTPVIRVMI